MILRQFELHEVTPKGHREYSELICWLEDDPRLKIGKCLTLKHAPDVLWRVWARYGTKNVKDINRGWKVGGLT